MSGEIKKATKISAFEFETESERIIVYSNDPVQIDCINGNSIKACINNISGSCVQVELVPGYSASLPLTQISAINLLHDQDKPRTKRKSANG